MKPQQRALLGLLCLATVCQAQSKLSVHGYLNQAFAISRSHQIFGIPTDGTTDYRNLALQFRYELNEDDNLTIQLNHSRSGLNPVFAGDDDVQLDWAYIQHNFSEKTSVKIGKIQMPFGIYNEIRDVGVLLPFYNLPYAPYGEGSYMGETIDGFNLSHSFTGWSPWELSFSFYGGHWEWVEWQRSIELGTGAIIDLVATAKVNNALGTQVWLSTPISGVRLGVNVASGSMSEGLNFGEGALFGNRRVFMEAASLDATFDHLFLRSEFLHLTLVDSDLMGLIYYVQGGVKFLNDRIGLHAQADFFEVHDVPLIEILVPLLRFEKASFDYNKNYAVGVSFALTSDLVLKTEAHWNRGYLVEDAFLFPYTQKPLDSQYAIFSLSTSF